MAHPSASVSRRGWSTQAWLDDDPRRYLPAGQAVHWKPLVSAVHSPLRSLPDPHVRRPHAWHAKPFTLAAHVPDRYCVGPHRTLSHAWHEPSLPLKRSAPHFLHVNPRPVVALHPTPSRSSSSAHAKPGHASHEAGLARLSSGWNVPAGHGVHANVGTPRATHSPLRMRPFPHE